MVETFELMAELLDRKIRISIYLPETGYPEERFPVVYMFDGQNLFEDQKATYGTSWGLKDFLDQWGKKVIVVGMECDTRGDNRLHEYMPYPKEKTFFGRTDGKGKRYLEWMVQTLKPWIDQNFPTWPQREATAAAGSSMGGLMAYYALFHFNQIFSKAACLSPSLIFCPQEAIDELDSCWMNPDTRVYFSFGSRELKGSQKAQALQLMEETVEKVRNKGGMAVGRMIENGEHNEASWRKENPDYFRFLFDEPERLGFYRAKERM